MLATRLRSTQEQPVKKAAAHPGDNPLELMLKQVVGILDDHKAQDVVVIPLAGKAGFADYLVIASGGSTRHVASMGSALDERMGNEVLGVEGMKEAEWVCVDMGAVVVHLFVPEKRSLYNLEKLWSHNFDAVDEA